MAEVYQGRAIGDEGFEKPVAIKRILPHYAADARFVSMLLTEARIHAQLSHRNIVQIHDLGISEEGEYFIVLEYVDGRDLAALLDVLPRTQAPDGWPLQLSDAVTLHIVIEIGEGVHFAHELRSADGQPANLVHRDISPSNVLLSYAGEVKLSDFGLAKRRTDHSVVGSLKGKLAYMSPEQARRAPLDRRSDIFALGAVLFELLTGGRLRDISDDVEGWKQVASGLVPSARPLRPDLPPEIDRLLTGALAPDPRDRFADARAFVAAARSALEAIPRPRMGESEELRALFAKLLPPGSPRPQVEASRVIRLVSEILPADETVRAVGPPIRPRAPVPAPVPGLTPPVPQAPVALPRPPAPQPSPPRPSPPRPSEPAGAPRAARPHVLRRLRSRIRRPPGKPAVAVVAIASVLTALVHFAFMPLPVLVTWRKPARLELRSQPSGADVHLDGRRLPGVTPAFVEIRRDRRPHLVEMRKEGFHPVRRFVRFDQMEVLSFQLALPAASRPSFRPIPPPGSAGQGAQREGSPRPP